MDLVGGRVGRSVAAGGVVCATGATLASVHVVHGVMEYPEAIDAILYGVALPFLSALGLTGAGFWTVRREWTAVPPWRLAQWTLGGVAVGAGVILLLALYQNTEGARLADLEFTVATFATYGGLGGVVLGRYDVQRKERRIEREREAARLDEFAQTVSHDLRNPLNVAQGRLELVREEYDDENLDSIESALERMERLIEDLLILAREGDRDRETSAVDLADAIERCWANVATGEATITVDVDETIVANESGLEQLLENLFRNAIDHAGDDVSVTVGSLEEGFYVEDDGPGIPEQDRERIFDTGYTTAKAGTGFGLDIVDKIADAHGWDVAARAAPDGGACFEITGVDVVDS